MSDTRIGVLHIIKSLGRGGAEMLLPETLRLHNKERFDFHYIYFLPWKNQMVESLQHYGGRVVCMNANNNVEIILRRKEIEKYIRTNNIRLIHAHLPWAGILARWVGKRCGIPVVYTEHNKQERYHIGTRVMNLLTMNLLTRIIAVSDDVASSIYKYKPRLKVPVQTIVNGVNVDHFNRRSFTDTSIREKFNIPTDAPVIGTIAVFRFQKRLDLWMDLASQILQRHPDAHFIIVGDGLLKGELIRKRASLGLEKRIHMPGLETEVRPYLAAFDVYMMSSVFEGLPIAMLEAMAMECPVVSTDAGGIKEVIRHDVDGLLCPVEEPQKLVEYAGFLIGRHDAREKFAAQSRRRVTEAFGMQKMVQALEDIYVKIAP